MATPLLYSTTKNAVQKTLDAALLSGVTAAVTLNNVVGIQNKAGVFVVDRVDANGTATPSKREYITFTGVSGSTLTTLVRNADSGGTDQDHAVGAIVEFVSDVLQEQAIIDALLLVVTTAGVLNKATGVTINTGTDDATIVTPKAIADSYLGSFNTNSLYRQAIINGNFDVWQRGTSFTNPATGTYVADRWAITGSDDGAFDVLKTADSPTVAQSGVYNPTCFHVDITTADSSLAAGQYVNVQQKIEGYNIASYGFGQTGTRYATLSFWVKAAKTGIHCVGFRNSAIDRSYIAEYTISSADTWEKKTITIPVDTTGTWLYTEVVGLIVNFALATGSTYQTAAGSWTAGNYFASSNQVNEFDNAANNFKLAQVQLCAGDVALPFMPKSFEEELRACMRYYETSYEYGVAVGTATDVGGQLVMGWGGASTNGNRMVACSKYQVIKRSAVAPVIYDFAGTAGKCTAYNADATQTAGITANQYDTNSKQAQIYADSTATTQRGLGFHWKCDAEL